MIDPIFFERRLNMIKHVIFPLTGDPIHFGHLHAIELISQMFEKVTVAFGDNYNKGDKLFRLEKRIEMLKNNIQHLKNIDITSFKGMLVSFVCEIGADAVIKPLRNQDDYKYEINLIEGGNTQLPIQTIFIPIEKEYQHISSSAVKAIISHGGFVHEMVPLNVKFGLERRKGQLIIGITGGIGTGKSFVTEKFAEFIKSKKSYPIHIVNFDKIVHLIYDGMKLNKPFYIKTRKKIVDKFGEDILQFPDKTTGYYNFYYIDRKKLAKKVVGDHLLLQDLSEILEFPLLELYKKTLLSFTHGIILLDCPLLVEAGYEFMCNNNIILVDALNNIRNDRLLTKGFILSDIFFLKDAQFDSNYKRTLINENIINDNFGSLYEIDNNGDDLTPSFEKIYEDLVIKKFEGFYD